MAWDLQAVVLRSVWGSGGGQLQREVVRGAAVRDIFRERGK